MPLASDDIGPLPVRNQVKATVANQSRAPKGFGVALFEGWVPWSGLNGRRGSPRRVALVPHSDPLALASS